MKRLTALLLCAALLLLLSSCGGNTPEEPGSTAATGDTVSAAPSDAAASQEQLITVPYTSADSLDPFEAKSEVNRELMYLIHAGLFYLNSSMTPVRLLASGEVVEGTSVRVDIREDACFSDGSSITASDVTASFERAKNSALYSGQLAGIESAAVTGTHSVSFKLSGADIFVLNCLTFPIVSGQGKQLIGAGKYYIDSTGDAPVLHLNRYCPVYSLSQNNVLELHDIAQSSGARFAFMTGDADVYTDTMEDYSFERLSSKTVTVSTNKLVYIGANTSGSSLASWEWLRRVINIGLDRAAVGGASFRGQALPASTPFNPALYALEGLELTGDAGDPARAAVLLEENGFDSLNADGYRTNGRLSLRLTLLVCEDNPFKTELATRVADMLKELGIRIAVDKRDTEQYKEALKAGDYELYIGEVNLCDNLNLSPFFSSSGAAHYGINDEHSQSYTSFVQGKTDITAYIESFYLQVPFIPVCYRTAVMSYNPDYSGVEAEFADMYASIYLWSTGSVS